MFGSSTQKPDHIPNIFYNSKPSPETKPAVCAESLQMELNPQQKGYSQFDNVRVPEEFQILNFSFDLPNYIQAAYFLSVEYFYCDFVPCQLVFANY